MVLNSPPQANIKLLIFSAIIYVLGNYTSQRIAGTKVTELNSLLSFGAYGYVNVRF